MESTALGVRLFLYVFLLLVAKDELGCCSFKSEAASLQIVANRLQLFEYDSIKCDCVGFDEFTKWRVMRRIMGVTTTCAAVLESTGPCRIENAYETDSGEYWCEAHGRWRSSSVNIIVTTGSVILKSPAVPVTEGEDVTLICINKMTSSAPKADYYKDGLLTYTGYKGNITIHNVSKSDEGLYKCVIPGVGESPESWLAIRAGSVILKRSAGPVTEGEDVTLICINKMTSSAPIADFYKDGLLTYTGYKGNITIHNVLKSDEGLYKCVIPGVGESPESWLAIRAPSPEKRPSDQWYLKVLILWIVCLVSVLLVIVGFGLCWKHRARICISPDQSVSRLWSSHTETVSEATGAARPNREAYSLVMAPNTHQTFTADCPLYESTY